MEVMFWAATVVFSDLRIEHFFESHGMRRSANTIDRQACCERSSVQHWRARLTDGLRLRHADHPR